MRVKVRGWVIQDASMKVITEIQGCMCVCVYSFASKKYRCKFIVLFFSSLIFKELLAFMF